MPLMNEVMLELVEEYALVDLSNNGGELSLAGGEIQYKLPRNQEKTFLEVDYFSQTIFRMFGLSDFVRLMNAVMLEKSLIFVGDPVLTSNAILGLNSLTYPFKWCFALIPILPRQMIDFLEAPLPLLVGITK